MIGLEYGITKANNIYVCEEFPDDANLAWIYWKINQCLRNNRSGGDYFYALERIRSVIKTEFLFRP